MNQNKMNETNQIKYEKDWERIMNEQDRVVRLIKILIKNQGDSEYNPLRDCQQNLHKDYSGSD